MNDEFNGRQPLVDPSTWEILLEVYQVVAPGDAAKRITSSDLAYMAGQLKTVLMLNSMPEVDPRTDPKILDQIRALGRKLKV